MFFTTSKKPTFHMRTIAHAFSCAIPDSSFAGRGKRSLGAILKKAIASFHSRACLVHKSKNGGCILTFLSLEDGAICRLSPSIEVKKILMGKKAPKKCLSLKITGSKSPTLKKLVGDLSPGGLPPLGAISAGPRLLSISIAGKAVLRAQVSYVEAKSDGLQDG